ncbi:Vacuolar morphogenesis protein 6 [Tulasnella sp. UAMH 9824]|nr:Vacuolar morphogenesis protein 6 [Tulasnella sp. UAMH 9824]
MSFGIDTSIQYSNEASDPASNAGQGVPSVVTRLAVGCKRKIVIYTWKDGEAQEVKELNLPHSPRSVVFSTSTTLVLSYTHTDHVLLKLPMMSTTEIALPAPPPASGSTGISAMGMGAFSGLGGYMTLGLGAKAKPAVYKVNDDGEFVVLKDALSTFFASEGHISRSGGLEWSGPPDETAFVKPYMLSIIPPESIPLPSSKTSGSPPSGAPAAPTTYQTPCIQIASTLSLSTTQIVPYPFSEDPSSLQKPAGTTTSPPSATSVRVLSASPSAKSPLFATSTPVDRTAAAAEGTTVWAFTMAGWGEQIDELVDAGSYADALALLDTLDTTALPDKEQRKAHIRGLHAVSVFSEGKYMEAIKTFIDLDINPAKVVALYPETIAGRLSVPRHKWIELYGGKPPKSASTDSDDKPPAAAGSTEGSTTNKIAGQLLAAVDAVVPALGDAIPSLSSSKDDDTRSIRSTTVGINTGSVGPKGKDKTKDDYQRSIENLLVYLGDRRPKFSGALQTFGITPAKAPELPNLSETSVDELFALPNQPPPSLIPEQLLRYAQIVDTALFKSYLVIRPSLVGSLCRLDNWCEVAEVEEVLKERKKFSELIDLYKTKKMHEKALSLLKDLSEDEDDPREKVDPTALYLQRLNVQYLPLIFNWTNWVLELSPERALKIFTSDEVDFPTKDVATYLAGRDLTLCARYVEYLMEEKHEESALFHNWLAEIYLDLTTEAINHNDTTAQQEVYGRLLRFLDSSTHYEADRIFARLPSDRFFEARAILLGRLGKHEAALDIYVNRLNDYSAAENYCKRVYQAEPDPKGVFLILLRIYLRPSIVGGQTASLAQALDLISRHSPRLDSAEALQLLPPLVNASDVRNFLYEALKTPKVDTRISRELWKAREHQVDRKLMLLQSKRVKITDTRICPQCLKRLGNSVIAVHAPRGEVTHYQCRDAFVKRNGQ